MKSNVIYIGIDVDDKAYHVGVLLTRTGEIQEWACKPVHELLISKLKPFLKNGLVKVCYEACHVGFTLHRALTNAGFHCDVISSSDIPRTAGAQVKTDRLDALKLTQYYATGLLKPIFVPSKEQEADRDLIRTRSFLKGQSSNIKRYILAICRRANINFRRSEGHSETSQYWTSTHRIWLEGAIKSLQEATWKTNLLALWANLKQLEGLIAFYDNEIEKLAETTRYSKAARAIKCFRGFETLNAMTILTEISTAKRFTHPKQITSFMGMDISEYSSGGKERKGGITKMGNAHLRTALIESCQYVDSRVQISRKLEARRARSPSRECGEIADRCMRRLHKRSYHLKSRGKPNNKVKVACAREMMGFVWEALNVVNF